MNFSYNPALINDHGLNQMRFELGDVFVEEPAKTTYLTDEEIIAAIEGSQSWRRAKFRLVETLLRRFLTRSTRKLKRPNGSLISALTNGKTFGSGLSLNLKSKNLVARSDSPAARPARQFSGLE